MAFCSLAFENVRRLFVSVGLWGYVHVYGFVYVFGTRACVWYPVWFGSEDQPAALKDHWGANFLQADFRK